MRSIVSQRIGKSRSKKLASSRVYRALLSQAGGSAPVAVVLENEIGAIVWTRIGEGQYIGTLVGRFKASRTFVLIGSLLDGIAGSTLAQADIGNTILLNTASSGVLSDDELSNTPIEIRIY